MWLMNTLSGLNSILREELKEVKLSYFFSVRSIFNIWFFPFRKMLYLRQKSNKATNTNHAGYYSVSTCQANSVVFTLSSLKLVSFFFITMSNSQWFWLLHLGLSVEAAWQIHNHRWLQLLTFSTLFMAIFVELDIGKKNSKPGHPVDISIYCH